MKILFINSIVKLTFRQYIFKNTSIVYFVTALAITRIRAPTIRNFQMNDSNKYAFLIAMIKRRNGNILNRIPKTIQ